ncbi:MULTISPECIES: hypothetical protein [Trichocoleus]|uniref:Uncharacterized protein n=1 Tax=Trichocoleus desertorum GB2-A4 TaxID=2933944 RepID=A0ABV0JJF6_9CYAN|nr:hypothetical protein [Trichocoleus sp. FACHB-46]MBD1864979.1 hypothetical protein [Trichocoleus sp. FACHB-46]
MALDDRPSCPSISSPNPIALPSTQPKIRSFLTLKAWLEVCVMERSPLYFTGAIAALSTQGSSQTCVSYG